MANGQPEKFVNRERIRRPCGSCKVRLGSAGRHFGEQPNNATWSGFQMVSENGLNNNYLLLFRELHNKETEKKIQLKFLAGKTIRITNVKTGEIETKRVDKNGMLAFTIARPADFLFLKYDIVS